MSRPRTFDLDAAIDTALLQFWSKGYEGTSLSELTEAMGINRPSFYAAFGSKESLFARVLDRYAEGPGAGVARALAAPTCRGVVEQLLAFYTDAPADPSWPRGCLLVQGALACGTETDSVREALCDRRRAIEEALHQRLKQGRAAGDLPAGENPAQLARYIWTICQGLCVEARGGATRAELRRVAAQALRMWPSA